MKITGFPPEMMTPAAVAKIQLAFAGNGMSAFWSESKELVVMAEHADMSLEQVMRAKSSKDGFPWVLREILSRVE
ncbi:hypothetical protein [Ramlibacter alkalitolerans]|nr:hypothetical protein [Ramlibacter alkalitolerans]